MSGNYAIELPPSLQPGEPAPDFTLGAIHKEGTVSLDMQLVEAFVTSAAKAKPSLAPPRLTVMAKAG